MTTTAPGWPRISARPIRVLPGPMRVSPWGSRDIGRGAGTRWRRLGRAGLARARDGFVEADASTPLEPDDLQGLASAAYLSGDDETSLGAWSRVYYTQVAAGDLGAAARCSSWQAFQPHPPDVPHARKNSSGCVARTFHLGRATAEVASDRRVFRRRGCADRTLHRLRHNGIRSSRSAYSRTSPTTPGGRGARDLLLRRRHE